MSSEKPNDLQPSNTNVPDITGERVSCLVMLAVMGIGIFALIVGWNGILNPPPKPTPEQLHQVKLQQQDVERQLDEIARRAEAQIRSESNTIKPSATPFHLSNGDAKQKYDRAVNLPPNWATQEYVDIIVRYSDSSEAAQAANMLIEKWDHILDRDFLKLTGQRVPHGYDLSRDETVEILNAAFKRRGLNPRK